MSKVYQKIEVAANIMIILVAVMLIGLVGYKYFFPASAPVAPPRKNPTVGNKVSIPDVDLPKKNKNVLLVLQKGCHFCSESAEFYKRLIEDTKNSNVTITAILPQKKDEAEEYLKSLGVLGIEVRQSQLNSLDVSGTPTIIVTNNVGEVSNVWVGKLPPEKEKEVLSYLKES